MIASSRTIAAASLALLVAVSLGGCGRRGALEAPPGAPAPAAKVVADDDEDERPKMPKGAGLIQDFTPGAAPTNKTKKDKAQRTPPPPARGSFFLDPLL